MLINCYTSRKDYSKKFASTVHRSLFATCLSAGMYGEVHLSYSYDFYEPYSTVEHDFYELYSTLEHD